jgi:hypothetical protein
MRKAAMRRQIKRGSEEIPAFGAILAPAELNDLIAYLRSCGEKQKK